MLSYAKRLLTSGRPHLTTLRLLNALNSEDRGLKVRFSLAMIVFETFALILCQMLSSQGQNAPSNPYPHYLVRLATSRYYPEAARVSHSHGQVRGGSSWHMEESDFFRGACMGDAFVYVCSLLCGVLCYDSSVCTQKLLEPLSLAAQNSTGVLNFFSTSLSGASRYCSLKSWPPEPAFQVLKAQLCLVETLPDPSRISTEQMDAAVLGDRLPEVTQKPSLGPKSLSLQFRH